MPESTRPSESTVSKHALSKDGTRVAYEQVGRGPALILIDGALAHRAYRGGRALARALEEHLTVVTYDRRGRGESGDTQPYSVDREIEDIEALVRVLGVPVSLYGFSSGSMLALRAAAKLSDRVVQLAVLEPPFDERTPEALQAFASYCDQMAQLLRQGRRGDAVEFFLKDMLPPEVLEAMKQTPDWPAMEAVAPTLAYDNAVMGDGCLPVDVAAAVQVPTLVLDGGDSPDFKHVAADALARAMPNAKRRTLADQTTRVPPEILAPVLLEFLRRS